MTVAADIAQWRQAPFVAYSYAYPHKSAYRRLTPPVALADAWRGVRRDALFLYLHVPFCEYRCGFCNLFTLANAGGDLAAAYLRQLRIEAEHVRDAIGELRFARLAIGGGTPTFLDERALDELFEIAASMGVQPAAIPASCEASPATLTLAKAQLLRERGVERVSLGVQTFDDAESGRLGRPQTASEVFRAIELVRACQFPVLNLDLIYGTPGQSVASWMQSVETAAQLRPEEIFLYPLYVRELTGLGRIAAAPSDNRLDAYRAARDLLLDAGYEQTSLRMFRLAASEITSGPDYCCQTDGMIGLGCGARSYTRELHYSTEFAVGKSGVRAILQDYLARHAASFRAAHRGFRLNGDERRRRFVIQSLLQAAGLDLAAYRAEFGSDVFEDLPQLADLLDAELASLADDRLQLTAAGLELSDAIGPWLYSPRVRRRMEAFACR